MTQERMAVVAQSSEQQIPFTGLVVTYNEARRLRDCLNSLAFCDQLMVVDLGSQDESVAIARQCGAEVLQHPWKPIVEQVWPEVVPLARHDWIIRADPDEVFPPALVQEITHIITQSKTVGLIAIPHLRYFNGTPLYTTAWGVTTIIPKVFHRARVSLKPHVHEGIILKNTYQLVKIAKNKNNFIQHYWVDSWEEFFEKHQRYLQHEGKALYHEGKRFSWFRLMGKTLSTLIKNLFFYKGLIGGPVGIFLSFYRAWYITMSWLSLRQYQKDLD